MAYDAATSQLILFGGVGLTGPAYNSTWTWTGSNWVKLSPATSPSGRSGGAIAFDPATGQFILFGGVGDDMQFNGTRTWTGSNWVKLSPATSPPASNAGLSQSRTSNALTRGFARGLAPSHQGCYKLWGETGDH